MQCQFNMYILYLYARIYFFIVCLTFNRGWTREILGVLQYVSASTRLTLRQTLSWCVRFLLKTRNVYFKDDMTVRAKLCIFIYSVDLLRSFGYTLNVHHNPRATPYIPAKWHVRPPMEVMSCFAITHSHLDRSSHQNVCKTFVTVYDKLSYYYLYVYLLYHTSHLYDKPALRQSGQFRRTVQGQYELMS